ncbi:hypothetical protein KR222_003130 [Zaprionus bogoriensis]|nr:hypothetical protein KR222_003130 [Zaprionus bogoriensis]
MNNVCGYVKRCLQRRHRLLGATCACAALLTFVLEHNYVGKQRDLLYWLELLRVTTHSPLFTCFLLLVSLSQLLLLLAVQMRLNQAMQMIFSEIALKYRRRKFADFIMRRMLLQLEVAMSRMPVPLDASALLTDPQLQRSYQQAKEAAYQAVDLFRRDAAALIFDRYQLPHEAAPFFVLKEEELALLHGGYAHIGLNVTHQVLWRLLYPHSAIVA